MIYGVISLICVQILLVLLTGAAYLRLRQHGDMNGREVLNWAVKIEAANTKADSAMVKADKLVTEQYDALAAKYSTLHTEYLELRRKYDDLEKRYESLRLSIAANAKREGRDRAKERAEEAAPAMPGQVPPRAAGGSIEEALRNGDAIPLFDPNGAKQTIVPRPSTFGQVAR